MARVETALFAMRPELERWYAETYAETVDEFAIATLQDLADRSGRVTKAIDDDPGFTEALVDFLGGSLAAEKIRDRWQERVSRYLRREAGTRIVQITGTQRDSIRRELKIGVDAGEGINELANRIDGLYGSEIIPNRAEVIARTEVIAASNLGGQEGAVAAGNAVGLQLEKQWVSLHDDRVRSAHSAYDAKEVWVDAEKPHQVTYQGRTEQLMFPGDASLGASAGNTIQCRCTQVYRTKP